MKLWHWLDGCDGPLVSCYLGVISLSDQVSIILQLPGLGGLTCPSDQEVELRNREQVQECLNT
jgi:hypothetical protein